MSNLDDIQIMIAKGNREEAAKRLVSILQLNIENFDAWVLLRDVREEAAKLLVPILRLNINDVNAWLLLGEVIDDPAKKKDCYNQALKLSPNNLLALNGLESLTSSNPISAEKPTADIQNTHSGSKNNWQGAVIAILSIGGLFGVSYILGLIVTSGDSSSTSNPLCMGMMCIGLIAGAFIWYSSGKNRSEVANTAIQEQKQVHSSNSKAYSSSKSNVISCRVCQHTVSRTAPLCPNCGELYPGLISKCPYCSSKNIYITPKGFSLGKAAAGAVIAGPLGAAGGLHGRKDLEVKCSNCHRILIIKHDEI